MNGDETPEQYARRHRMLANAVTDEMLTKRTGDLNEAEVALLMRVLQGPHADELMARADAINEHP